MRGHFSVGPQGSASSVYRRAFRTGRSIQARRAGFEVALSSRRRMGTFARPRQQPSNQGSGLRLFGIGRKQYSPYCNRYRPIPKNRGPDPAAEDDPYAKTLKYRNFKTCKRVNFPRVQSGVTTADRDAPRAPLRRSRPSLTASSISLAMNPLSLFDVREHLHARLEADPATSEKTPG